MAAPRRPTTRTESECITETVRATHASKITGYRLKKSLDPGQYIRSSTFTAGDYDWCLLYYPSSNTDENKDCISVFLELLTRDSTVRALYDLRLVNQVTGVSSSIFCSKTERQFKTGDPKGGSWGLRRFMTTSSLEASPYLQDDSLIIECDITVILGTSVLESTTCDIQVPRSTLSNDLRILLEAGEHTDVTFEVEGEIFHAHRIVLAMRSPVFKTELYGPVGEDNRKCILINDMQAPIFKALLHFIYTDSMPSMDDLGKDEHEEAVKHLLVAADRYDLDTLKVTCESILAKKLDIDGVADTLALADQYNCDKLKDACIEFINSSNRAEQVQASQGYPHLKRAHPSVIAEIWERATKSRRI